MKKIITIVSILACLVASCCRTSPVSFEWGTTDVKYAQDVKPELGDCQAFNFPAWRGEKINAQAVLWTEEALDAVSVELSDLKCGSSKIPAGNAKASLVGYVKSDVFSNKYSQCDKRVAKEWDSLMVADIIGVADQVKVEAQNAQPVWVSVSVPAEAGAGCYTGKLTVRNNGRKIASLPMTFNVVDEVLPDPSQWAFHLDLWQNPYAVARYYGDKLWSESHFEHLRPVMSMLANAGQKVVTTSIMKRPWNGQTEDPFDSMVVKTLSADGRWSYDYSIFDKWVEFMMSLGIDSQINCYTLIPWALSFDYIDAQTGEEKFVKAEPGTKAYDNYWGSFILDFSRHLREKGWFEKTMIAMDERSQEAMKAAMALIKSIDPELKVALAGNYHPEIADDIDDLCVTTIQEFPQGVIEARRERGQISTLYTCCAEKYPNTFTLSKPSEATWIPWLSLSHNLDGYLRWAYNSWTTDPMHDTRFRTWAAGDCYMVYPDGLSSIRFEKLREGIQDYTKAVIMKETWASQGKQDKIDALNEVLTRFTLQEIEQNGCVPAITAARTLLYQ